MAINNILESTLNYYPVFKPNQVLTDGQLNDIVAYLDGQNRLTRVLLLGTGIACGFEPIWVESAKELYVSSGFGVTSEGYLISETEKHLNLSQDRDIPVTWFGFENTDGLPNFFKVEALLSGTASKTDGTKPIPNKDFLQNKVLIYLLELNTPDNLGLCNNDCDERGSKRQFILHRLLFSEEDALLILDKTYEQGTVGLEDKFYHKYKMPHLAIPRFGYETDVVGQSHSIRLDNIKDYETFLGKYKTILIKLAGDLLDALETKEVHRVFSPILTPGETLAPPVEITDIVNKITNEDYDILEIQYLYDHLSDLADAYQEFIEAAFDLIADCNFHPKHFPNHLLIRQFDGNGDPVTAPDSVFRTPYTQPPVYNENRNRLKDVRTLYNRLMLLAGSYTTPSVVGADEIKITPGKSFRAPLSDRAVPYYYPASLVNTWNPRQNRFNRAGQVYSYHRPTQAPYNDPLIYEMEGSDFFRIEGHIGRDFWEVRNRLNELRTKYNLPFHVIALKIGEELNSRIFQFECEKYECELELLRDKYLSIKQRFNEEVIGTLPQDDQDLITQEFKNTLKDTLDLFNYTDFNNQYDLQKKEIIIIPEIHLPPFPPIPAQTIWVPILPMKEKIPFYQIRHCYDEIDSKITEVKNRHLFHYFAGTNPGLDHKGGVPVGGTFVLVYVGEETVPVNPDPSVRVTSILNDVSDIQPSGIVVADFYLPYACCSDCPPICYVQPKPVFLIKPNVFCKGSTVEKELKEIVALPAGGVIWGRGYSFHDGKHWFLPAAVDPDDTQTKLFYAVNGAVAEAAISLTEPANADFDMKFNGLIIEDMTICEGEGPVVLEAAVSGGTFYVTENGEQEVPLNGNTYDSAEVDVAPDMPVQVVIRHVLESENCEPEVSKTLTIAPKPNASFTFAGNQTQVCQDGGRIQLNPAEAGGAFTAKIGNTETPDVIVPELGKWYLDPETISVNPGKSVIVTVKHKITTAAGCTDSAELPITVIAKANSTFTIGNNLKQICQTANPVQLTPIAPGGTFKAFVQGNQVPGAILSNSQFNPKAITLQGNNPVTVNIQYEVSVNGACPASHSQPIVVTPPPVAGFDAAFLVGSNPDAKTVQVRVSGIKPQNAAKYNWTSTPEQSNPANFPNNSNDFVITYFLKDELLPIQLDLVVESGGCPSAKVSKTLLPLMQGFELYGVDPNGGEFLLVIIEDGKTYPPDQFDSLLFNIRAIPFPFEVDHVVIELNDSLGNTIQHTSSTSKDYRLVEGTDPRLPVKEADYTVKATPFTKNGTAGTPRVVHFSIASDEVPRQPAPPAEPSEEAIAFLRKRDNAYRKEIDNLKSDENLANTAGFQLAEGFAKFQGQAAELNERYEKTAKALLAEAGSVKKGSARHEQVLQLLTSITHYFMDKQVFLAPQKLSTETLKTLEKQLPGIKKAGLTITEIKTAWQGEALKKQLQAKSVDQFIKVLK